VDRHRSVPVKSFALGEDPDAAPPAQCAAKKIAKAAGFQQFRPSNFCRPLSDFATHCECLGDRKAGDGHSLASCRVSLVLALEVAISPAEPQVLSGVTTPRSPQCISRWLQLHTYVPVFSNIHRAFSHNAFSVSLDGCGKNEDLLPR
jgi:hypothetical protein